MQKRIIILTGILLALIVGTALFMSSKNAVKNKAVNIDTEKAVAIEGAATSETAIPVEEVTKESPSEQAEPASAPTTTPTPVPVADKPALTPAEVARHNSKESCWMIVNGGVYDVTSYIDRHPGGPGKILPNCGKDGTKAFMGEHGGDSKPENQLAKLKIGNLQ